MMYFTRKRQLWLAMLASTGHHHQLEAEGKATVSVDSAMSAVYGYKDQMNQANKWHTTAAATLGYSLARNTQDQHDVPPALSSVLRQVTRHSHTPPRSLAQDNTTSSEHQ